VSSRKTAPEVRARGVLPGRWACGRGRQRGGWALVVSLVWS